MIYICIISFKLYEKNNLNDEIETTSFRNYIRLESKLISQGNNI